MNDFMKKFSLEGKVALITGASYGIGFAIASAYAQAGATIVFNDIKQELVDKGLAAYEEKGIKAHGYVCDVTNEEQVQALVAQVEKEVGVIDILVNNAGITKDNLLMKISEEDFDAVIDTNLKGTFHTIKCMYRAFLKQKGGRIINLSSVSGVLGNAGQANYAASKAGVIGLTKSVARELASRNVTVNAVAPGFIDTDMTQAMSESAKEATINQIPLKRVGQPKEIAETVAFLASDKAAYITGQVISVDGGMAI